LAGNASLDCLTQLVGMFLAIHKAISRLPSFGRSANASERRECRVPNNNCVQVRMLCRVGTSKRVSLENFMFNFIMFLSIFSRRRTAGFLTVGVVDSFTDILLRAGSASKDSVRS
jgi:hypothetical protein